jgi:copper chaperone NosL
MKKTYIILAGLLICFLFTTATAEIDEDIRIHKSCKICGMSRETFAQSRMLIEYDPEHIAGTCSIRCAALDMSLNMGRVPKSIQVGNVTDGHLIHADKAFWVIGGRKEGVMSTRGKWAFRDKAAAEKFMATNKGKSGTFQDALRAAFTDLYTDLKLFWDSMKKNGQ